MQVTLPDSLIEEVSQYIALDNHSEALTKVIQEWLKHKKNRHHSDKEQIVEEQIIDIQWSDDYKKNVLGHWQIR